MVGDLAGKSEERSLYIVLVFLLQCFYYSTKGHAKQKQMKNIQTKKAIQRERDQTR